MPPVASIPACLAQLTLLLVLFRGASPSYAQSVPDSSATDTTDLSRHLERVLDAFGDTDRLTTQAAERLTHLRDNPLNVNHASAADLSVLPGVSVNGAHRIVRHRQDQGPYETWSALQDVKGITSNTLQSLRPFVVVGTASNATIFPAFDTIVSNLEFSLIQRYSRRLDLGRGYREDRFLGPPGRLTSRLRLDYERRMQIALTVDKDPGEPLRWAPGTQTYGFDHVAGSIAVRDLGPLETLVIGDFTAQFGQGVALWQGLRFGKGRDPVSPVLQHGRGILPYRSASEANFFRGAAGTVGLLDGLSLTAFASHRNRDASLDSSLVASSAPSAPLPTRTISVGGYHRTSTELARKGTFGETTIGGALEYHASKVHLGAAGYQARFNRPLRPGDAPYRRYRVAGRQTSMLGAYATAYLNDYTLFGEVARAPSGAYGAIMGAALEEGDVADFILLGRWYPPKLANHYGSAFGGGSRTQNEIGIYTGLRLQVAKNWTVGGYFDQFRAPWLRFNVPRPTTGWEARGVLEYDPRPWLSTYLQLRAQGEDESTEHAGPGPQTLEGIQKEHRYSARWHTEYSFSEELTVRTRLQFSQHSTSTTSAEGFLLSQGLRWTPHSSMQVDAQIAFFDTEGFAARIYAYEHDLLYSFSVPVFFDRGRRSYLLIQYAPLPSLTLEAKYGITTYDNRSTIGSGLNQIEGSRRRELRAQIRWTL